MQTQQQQQKQQHEHQHQQQANNNNNNIEGSAQQQLPEPLPAKLGRVPSQLNTASSSAPGQDTQQRPPPHVQLSQSKRNHSTPEQFQYVLTPSDQAAAAAQLRNSAYFTMQFLEPPNSQPASGQLVHPALATHASRARVSAAGAGSAAERAVVVPLSTVTSIPHTTCLVRAGMPMINANGVSWGGGGGEGRRHAWQLIN